MSDASLPTLPEQAALEALYAEVRACTLCAKHLSLGPRPIVRGKASARLLVVSQAPGTRVHMTGLSFNDRSGDRLREWLGDLLDGRSVPVHLRGARFTSWTTGTSLFIAS